MSSSILWTQDNRIILLTAEGRISATCTEMQGKSYSAEQMEAEYIRGNIKKMDKFRFSTRKAYIILSEYYFPLFNIQAMCMFIKDINSG